MVGSFNIIRVLVHEFVLYRGYGDTRTYMYMYM